MFTKILVPLDGSKLAEAVLPYATRLATSFGARTLLVQVVPPASQVLGLAGGPDMGPVVAPYANAISAALEAQLREAESYLKGIAARLKDEGVAIEWKVLQGPVGPTIVRCAKEESVDLIALSTHGRSGLGRLIFGSIADYVLRAAGLPILLIKPDRKGEGER